MANNEKYLWSSTEFEKWVKNQQKELKKAGFKVSTAGVTHKLVNEVLVPNKIKLNFPSMQMVKRRTRKRKNVCK